MPHLSKKKIKRKVYLEIQDEFVSLLSNKGDVSHTRNLYYSLFTYTERLMLSKRLAIIAMLESGVTSYAIEKRLKVSPSTVARIALNKENGLYDSILKSRSLKKNTDFWKNLNEILTLGFPPIAGRGRWKKTFIKKL